MDPAAPHILLKARGPLVGSVAVPGDKSISHRVMLLGLLAAGPCRASGWLVSEDTLASLGAVEILGAKVERAGDRLTITPPSVPPVGNLAIDCGNSGTTCRLLCGLLAGWLPAGTTVTLTGDTSLSSRPMGRVVDPLRAMGARIEFLETEGCLPLRLTGGPLRGCHHELPVPSAQVKSALLLAGLNAAGVTTISGIGGSRDHTELMLQTMGVSTSPGASGAELCITGGALPGAFVVQVPGDPSTAAFFQVAAALLPGSDLLTTGISLNHTRTGALRVLRQAGVQVSIERPHGPPDGETLGDVRIRPGVLRPFSITGPDVPGLVDEIPVLAVLATGIGGQSVIAGAEELRVKESDRLSVMADNLLRLGADLEERPDGLRITGCTSLSGGPVGAPLLLKTAGDHRVAIAMAVAAAVGQGHSTLDDFDCPAVSFPKFFAAFATLLDDGVSDRPF